MRFADLSYLTSRLSRNPSVRRLTSPPSERLENGGHVHRPPPDETKARTRAANGRAAGTRALSPARRVARRLRQSSRDRRRVSFVIVDLCGRFARYRPCWNARARLFFRDTHSRERERMACNRATKSGFAAEAQRKVRGSRWKTYMSHRFLVLRSIEGGPPATLTQSTATHSHCPPHACCPSAREYVGLDLPRVHFRAAAIRLRRTNSHVRGTRCWHRPAGGW